MCQRQAIILTAKCSTEHREVGWVKTKPEKKRLPSPRGGGQDQREQCKRCRLTMGVGWGRMESSLGKGWGPMTRRVLYMTSTGLATCDFGDNFPTSFSHNTAIVFSHIYSLELVVVSLKSQHPGSESWTIRSSRSVSPTEFEVTKHGEIKLVLTGSFLHAG